MNVNLTTKNVALNLFYYGLTMVLFPWIILSLEATFGITRHPSAVTRIPSVLLGIMGAALQLRCIFLFQSLGSGTPSPALAPTKLVTGGPYGRIRNPMNVGELLIFAALACWFGSPFLLGYTILAGLAFHGFIVLWEEPRHLTLFREEYSKYKTRVRRWLPTCKHQF